MNFYLGQIGIYGFNFAPTGWAFCAGTILPISQNTALFSLIGTYYGGNGQTTFALPDLHSRTPMDVGTQTVIGEVAGDTGDEDAEGGTFIRCAGDFPPLVTYAPDKGAPPHLDTDRSLSSA